MKFAGIVILVASTSAISIPDYMDCLPGQTCTTSTFKCCNLITSTFGAVATGGTMICGDPTSGYGIIPSTTTTAYGGGRFACSKTQMLGTGAVQLAASGVAALSAALYLY